MVKVRGKQEVRVFFGDLPDKLRQVLRGAAIAGAKVIAEEAKLRSISPDVSAAIKVRRPKIDDSEIVAKIVVRGRGAHLAPWLEYGTDPHFISVDESQRQAGGIRSMNRAGNATNSSHTLVIGGQFVGTTVLHPGARPYPFLRPALDDKSREAVAAAQSYINARITPQGVRGTPESDDE